MITNTTIDTVNQFLMQDSTKVKSKACSHCKKVKPITEFYKSSENKDGYQHMCKECMREAGRIRDQKKREARKNLKETMFTPVNEESKEPMKKESKPKSTTTPAPAIHPQASLKDFSTESLIKDAKKRKDFDLSKLFTPRELMGALYTLGYRGELKIMIEQKVMLSSDMAVSY